MKPLSFKRHRFPPDVIRHAVWLYFRFSLSFRDVEELLAGFVVGEGLDLFIGLDGARSAWYDGNLALNGELPSKGQLPVGGTARADLGLHGVDPSREVL